MATYIIGDVQGCYRELMQLLAQIHFNEHTDRLWFAGDLINRGPDSLAVLRCLSRLPAHHQSVLGNHDLYCLSVVLAQQAVKDKDTLAALYQAPDRHALVAWLRRQPLALYDRHFNTLVVHAGVAPSWTLEVTLSLAQEVSEQLQGQNAPAVLQQMYGDEPALWQPQLTGVDRWRCIINYLTRSRVCRADGGLHLAYKRGLSDIPKDLMPWYQHPARQTQHCRIVFGHWAALLGDSGGAFGVEAVDTGCAWGHGLTAYRLEDNQRFFVASTLT